MVVSDPGVRLTLGSAHGSAGGREVVRSGTNSRSGDGGRFSRAGTSSRLCGAVVRSGTSARLRGGVRGPLRVGKGSDEVLTGRRRVRHARGRRLQLRPRLLSTTWLVSSPRPRRWLVRGTSALRYTHSLLSSLPLVLDVIPYPAVSPPHVASSLLFLGAPSTLEVASSSSSLDLSLPPVHWTFSLLFASPLSSMI